MVLPCSIPQPSPSCSKCGSQGKPWTKAALLSLNGNSCKCPRVTFALPAGRRCSAGPIAAWLSPCLGFEELVAALPFLCLCSGFMGLEMFLLLGALKQLRRIRLLFPRVGCVLEAGGGLGGFILLGGVS